MKKSSLLFILIFLSLQNISAQDRIDINENLFLVKLSDNSYIHTSYFDSKEWGRFPSNGLLVVHDGQGILIDTPMSDELTTDLLSWIEDSMRVKLIAFIPNHWHNDCTEGMDLITEENIPTYGYFLTNNFLKENNESPTQYSFNDSLSLSLGNNNVECRYLGQGHTPDNIVVWLPSEKILFTGCMVKSLNSSSLGNTEDANLTDWPKTLQKILDKYPDAKVVIPGHGDFGDLSLVRHTLTLFDK